MRLAQFTLIGFLTFTFCASMCPMNGNDASVAMDHSIHGEHMAHQQAAEADDVAGCEHCQDKIDQDLAMFDNPVYDSGITIAVAADTKPILPISLAVSAIPRTHLAAADPPLASLLVKTIVLRT